MGWGAATLHLDGCQAVAKPKYEMGGMGDANTAAFEELATDVSGLHVDLQWLQTGTDQILAEHLALQVFQDAAVAGLDDKLDSIAGTAGDTLALVQDPQP
jgi:hypothetical protein